MFLGKVNVTWHLSVLWLAFGASSSNWAAASCSSAQGGGDCNAGAFQAPLSRRNASQSPAALPAAARVSPPSHTAQPGGGQSAGQWPATLVSNQNPKLSPKLCYVMLQLCPKNDTHTAKKCESQGTNPFTAILWQWSWDYSLGCSLQGPQYNKCDMGLYLSDQNSMSAHLRHWLLCSQD